MSSDGAPLKTDKKNLYLTSSLANSELVYVNECLGLFYLIPAFILLLLLFKREMTCYPAYCSMMYLIPC